MSRRRPRATPPDDDPALDTGADAAFAQRGEDGPGFGRSRYASGIYGTIVAASVLAAASGDTFGKEVLLVVVTVLVYWVAEQYADILAHSLAGHHPSYPVIRAGFRRGFPMVQASYIPVVILVLSWAVGLSVSVGANLALVACVGVLVTLGWRGGRARELRLRGCVLSATIAGSLGLVMVLLKVLLHH